MSKQYDVFYRTIEFFCSPFDDSSVSAFAGRRPGLSDWSAVGPDGSGIQVTLMAACSACVKLVAWAGDTLNSAELNELSQCLDAYKRMISEMGTHAPPT